MSTTTLERPDVTAADTDDDVDHYYCCDPYETICGLRYDNLDDVDQCAADCEHAECELCVRAIDEPCDDPKCPSRVRWWQLWR
jgi:hypothetical protein